MRKCEACGTTKNLGPSLGGVLLCRDHYHDISAQVEQLRADGKQVNVAGMARQMFREQFSTGNYILRDIPKELWDAAKHKAVDDGVSLRELVLTAVQKHLDSKEIKNMNSIANSASSICNYCGAIYDAKYGAHICNVDNLAILIDQEQNMTDEPDERTIAKLEIRIAEVRKFWQDHPNHKSELSHNISS